MPHRPSLLRLVANFWDRHGFRPPRSGCRAAFKVHYRSAVYREDIAPIRLTEDTKVKAPIAAAIRWKDIKSEADGNEKLLNPESTEESWNLCRSVGEGRGKVAVRV